MSSGRESASEREERAKRDWEEQRVRERDRRARGGASETCLANESIAQC